MSRIFLKDNDVFITNSEFNIDDKFITIVTAKPVIVKSEDGTKERTWKETIMIINTDEIKYIES